MKIRKPVFLAFISLLLVAVLLLGCGVPRAEHEKTLSDLQLAQTSLAQLRIESERSKAEAERLSGDLALLNDAYAEMESAYKAEAQRLSGELATLNDDYAKLETAYNLLSSEYVGALAELAQSLKPPYTAISGREITWAWEDTKGELQSWGYSVDSYRMWIELPEPGETVTLDCGGKLYSMVDFRGYVQEGPFKTVVNNLYARCGDEMEFAKEIFNLVTQLTVYSEEVGEVPRWPAETLTEAGGDCEDLAILFASLLKAAPYPYQIKLVYMDALHPESPQVPNHVAVYFQTDAQSIFVDCTSKQGWACYDRVIGWYYEVGG